MLRATKRRALRLASLLLPLAATAVFLTDPARYARSVLEGVSLWAECVLPAAFPFLFFTGLLTALPAFRSAADRLARPVGRLYRVSNAGGGAALLAALSGYPVGAKMVLDLSERGLLARGEEQRLAALVTTSGPSFLVGTVGGMMFSDLKAGWLLFFCHLVAVRLVCLLFRGRGRRGSVPREVLSPPRNILYESVYNAVISVLCVGGFIALFSCIGQMLSDLGLFALLSPLFGGGALGEGVLKGLLEMTAGCAALSKSGSFFALPLCCALVTFGGSCVLCQQAAYLTRAGVKLLPFLGIKLLQSAVAFGACCLLLLLF